MEVKIASDWKVYLKKEFKKPYFLNLINFIKFEYKNYVCYPAGGEIFSAFSHCRFEKIKVVILGQDPYHGKNQANGLSFSVRPGISIPPSLQNIFKEIEEDLNKPFPKNGDLSRWANQGVLLLNATLTVRKASAGSHQNKGWEIFTDAVIKLISDYRENLVFLLWGAYAQKKGMIINKTKHYVLTSAHPSPFSSHKGFFGCKHFSKANSFLKEKGIEPIDW